VPPFHVPLMSIVVTNMALSKCVPVQNPIVMTGHMPFQETVTFNRNPIRSRVLNCFAEKWFQVRSLGTHDSLILTGSSLFIVLIDVSSDVADRKR
jgi:hypothetical protein